MKKCFKCGEEKPDSDFYAHAKMSDGRLGKCKECTKSDVKENRDRRRRQYHEYEARRRQLPERKQKQAEYRRRSYLANPVKWIARNAVANAVRSGRLIRRPCEYCGNPKTEAHHGDYTKPLDVRWLCFRCHREKAHGQTVV